MSIDVQVRKTELEDDLKEISIMLIENQRELYKVEDLTLEVAFDHVKRFQQEGCVFWIAESEETAVGYAMGDKKSELFKSKGVYVVPHNRKQGIGKMLKKAQIEHAKSEKCGLTYTNTKEWNTPAKKLLTSMGFEYNAKDDTYDLYI